MKLRTFRPWVWGLFASCIAMESAPVEPNVGVQDDGPAPDDSPADSSARATFLTLSFDGRVDGADSSAIRSQLLYLVGQLKKFQATPRLDQVQLSGVGARGEEGTFYHAEVPVAWGNAVIPSSVTLTLPRRATETELNHFATAYRTRCIDPTRSDLIGTTAANYWYYFRPDRCLPGGDWFRYNRNRNIFTEGDVVSVDADVTVREQSRASYPEYDKVWEDNAFYAIAVFGKYRRGGGVRDQGVLEFNEFVRSATERARSFGDVSVTPELQGDPGPLHPEVSISAWANDGRVLSVRVFLTEDIRDDADGNTDLARSLRLRTASADLIAYSGHSGTSRIRWLSQLGTWRAQQYLLLFHGGCDSYSFLDPDLVLARAMLNPDDPTGTRHLDQLAFVMPTPTSSGADVSIALFEALLEREHPRSYQEILARTPPQAIAVVVGDEDNSFRPH